MGRVALGLALAVVFSTRCWAAGEEVEITPDVVYGHKDGMALTYDVFRPKENANGLGVLFMVSGGWYSRWSPPESRQAFFKPMLDRGFTVLAVRHGSAPRYKVPEAVADVRLAVRHIRLHAADYRIDPERLGVYGMSAGGHLSLCLPQPRTRATPRPRMKFSAKAAGLRPPWPITPRAISVRG